MSHSGDGAIAPAVNLHFDLDRRAQRPHSVLLFAILLQRMVWVKHPVRGWEVPGGKVEPGELPEDAVRREAMEEAGLVLEGVEWIAEYWIQVDGKLVPKWVYVADVYDVCARPETSEIVDVRCPKPLWTPDVVRQMADVSPVMIDQVYERVWPLIEGRMSPEFRNYFEANEVKPNVRDE